MKIQLFGERCSGTNYIEQLIMRNSPTARCIPIYGFKHSYPKPSYERPDLVLIVCRHPYSWLRSLYRTPWGAVDAMRGLTFSEFLRTPWVARWDGYSLPPEDDRLGKEVLEERDPVTLDPHENVLLMRSSKYHAWLALGHSHPVLIARLEDWQADPLAGLQSLPIELNEEFVSVVHYKGVESFGVYQPTQFDPITKDDVRWIYSELDMNVERQLGYQLRHDGQLLESVSG